MGPSQFQLHPTHLAVLEHILILHPQSLVEARLDDRPHCTEVHEQRFPLVNQRHAHVWIQVTGDARARKAAPDDNDMNVC